MRTVKAWLPAFALGAALWAMLMILLFFAGNLASSKFIYVDF
jgi:hypothetical protein